MFVFMRVPILALLIGADLISASVLPHPELDIKPWQRFEPPIDRSVNKEKLVRTSPKGIFSY